MNKQNTGERRHEWMHYRLQSPRRKKRMWREDFEKKLLAIERERSALRQQQRELGWTELDPPVMRGWKRYFVLREDVARGKHRGFFQQILEKINTVQVSDKKTFTAKRRKWGRKIEVAREQKLLMPDEHQFRRMNFSEREKQFFYEFTDRGHRGKTVKRFAFVEPWRFVLRVRPNLITKTRIRDEAIEQRLQEIKEYLVQNDLEGTLDHLLFGRQRYRWKTDDRLKEKYRFKQMPLRQVVEDGRLN